MWFSCYESNNGFSVSFLFCIPKKDENSQVFVIFVFLLEAKNRSSFLSSLVFVSRSVKRSLNLFSSPAFQIIFEVKIILKIK